MTVWYILMAFPSPSETFVANDVRALRLLGIDVSVHALHGARPDDERLLRERGLAGLEVTHRTTRSFVRALKVAGRHPLRVARLIGWVVRQSGGRPVHLFKGLALLPRVLELFDQIEHKQPD